MLKIPCDLTYRSLICVVLLVKKRYALQNKWLYIHDKDVEFCRISEPKLFSKFNSPSNSTSLVVEIPCHTNDQIWHDKTIGDKVVDQLNDMGIVRKGKMEILGVHRICFAYPIFTLGYKLSLGRVMKEISSIQNLKVAGRTGSFRYLNMDACIGLAVQ